MGTAKHPDGPSKQTSRPNQPQRRERACSVSRMGSSQVCECSWVLACVVLTFTGTRVRCVVLTFTGTRVPGSVPSLSAQDHGRACRPTRPMGPRPARAAVLHPRHSHANNVCFRLHPGRHMDRTFSAQARLAPPLVATLLVWPVHAAPRRATRMVYVSAAAHSRASRAGSQHGCHRRAALTHSDRAHSGRLLPTLPRLLDARVRLG